jgi:hypothetical protein
MEFGVLCYILPSLLRFPGRVTMPFLYCLPHVSSSGMICGGNDNSQYIKHSYYFCLNISQPLVCSLVVDAKPIVSSC